MLELIRPSEAYLYSYLAACRENMELKVSTYTLHNPNYFEIWRHTIFSDYARQESRRVFGGNSVPSTTFWSVMDGQFVGIGNIRHKLNPSLKRFGGHIGYAIRPSYWGRGLGTRQLRLLLAEAAKLDIGPALITCSHDNHGSARVIEKNGGMYIDTVPNVVDGKHILTRRYWASTKISAD